ncbi:MAG TPA: shikimate dehydrogenase [Gallionella sp.]
MTDRYAVIGNPIAHSKSPEIHTMFAEQTGQDISYEAILAPLDGFAATVEWLRKEGYKGCNVTVPFKQSAYQLSNHKQYLSYDVVHAHAANTLEFRSDGVHLRNTDGIGLIRDIQDNCGVLLRGKRVLLMGAGGAARGVLSPLRDAGANITVANRTVDKAIVLAERFVVSSCSYEELAGKQFDVVINATSTGLSDEMPPLPPGIFAPGALAYDMMYGRVTPFMKFAREHGAVVSDGLGMLVEQAAESFFIWRGVRPETAPVIAALRKRQ